MKSGEEQPSRGPNGELAVYTLAADGTFHIALGDSTIETGTWTEDTSASPKIFDHVPNVDGKPGPLVPGIFAIVGDTLTVSIRPPNAEGRHPTEFRSSAAESGHYVHVDALDLSTRAVRRVAEAAMARR